MIFEKFHDNIPDYFITQFNWNENCKLRQCQVDTRWYVQYFSVERYGTILFPFERDQRNDSAKYEHNRGVKWDIKQNKEQTQPLSTP